jgi:two-component system, OmpR family, response regulator
VRVLVVEDEDVIAAALIEGLTAEGYAVDRAADGETGLWMATESSYDAIILDLMLPKMNGFVVCRTLRERNVATPILVLTAKDGEFDQVEILDTGADDYLAKPFSFVVLLARLRAMLRRGPSQLPTQLELDGIELDPALHRCRRNGVDIELSPREFALLRYLMHNAGRAVTKRELIEHVWGDDEIDDNVLQVYIGYLRRKVDEPFRRNTIETVRGIGYRLSRAGG